MGSWGNKIGDSDQALNVFELVARDVDYMKAILNKEDIIFYSNYEEVLCAIAVLDTQFNGIDSRIWGTYITDNDKYMNTLKALQEWTPRYELIKTALYKLDLIKQITQDFWAKERDKEERNEIIGLLKERLQEVNKGIYDYLDNRILK